MVKEARSLAVFLAGATLLFLASSELAWAQSPAQSKDLEACPPPIYGKRLGVITDLAFACGSGA